MGEYMSKGVRLSETWFNRGLWVISLIFASFLIGLGSLVMSDLPQVEQPFTVEQYADQVALRPLDSEISAKQKAGETKDAERARLELQANNARDVSNEARQTFDNWVETRRATGLTDQDPELISRTKALDALKAKESELNRQISAIDQERLAITQSTEALNAKRTSLINAAQGQYDAQYRAQELRIFLYRLMVTFPLILIAGWLFIKFRKSRQWPFIWGFIFFALFAFFVELVPYLPSYGGYVRYIVGIVLTLIVGRFIINALRAYLERQREEEMKPDTKRREELDYDVALNRLAKKVCAGCERPVNLEDTERNFCTHCGICLFDQCTGCSTRKSAFARFCQACGLVRKPNEKENEAAAPA
jgi:hypothetical protein